MIELRGDGSVKLESLFGTIIWGTFVFNLVVILPLMLGAVLVGVPVAEDGIAIGPLSVDITQSTVMLLLFTPLVGGVAGFQNAIVVCGGLALHRWIKSFRSSSPTPSPSA